MNSRERFMAVMGFGTVDEYPLLANLGGGAYNVAVEGSVTANRWYSEGLPPSSSIADHFGVDFAYEQLPVYLGMVPPFTQETLLVDERCVIIRDSDGVKKRVFKRRSSLGVHQWGMPQFLEFPVKERGDWEEVKRRFDPLDPRRLGVQWGPELIRHYGVTTNPVCVGVSGLFAWCSGLMGLEGFLKALYRDPGLIHDMVEFRAGFTVDVLEPLLEGCRIDFALLGEDMAYNRGPHISPRHFREFLVPGYKEETRLLRRHGVDLVFVDNEGDVRPIIPLWLEAGINGMFPLEVRAGNDAVELRKEYPRELRMVGNIDKFALIEGREAIDRELEHKLPFLLGQGGYLPTVDHGIPPEVPLEHYRYYRKRLKEYLSER